MIIHRVGVPSSALAATFPLDIGLKLAFVRALLADERAHSYLKLALRQGRYHTPIRFVK